MCWRRVLCCAVLRTLQARDLKTLKVLGYAGMQSFVKEDTLSKKIPGTEKTLADFAEKRIKETVQCMRKSVRTGCFCMPGFLSL